MQSKQKLKFMLFFLPTQDQDLLLLKNKIPYNEIPKKIFKTLN